ncbi:MAG: hypothetical protein QHH75_02700 [Bacillota bacterium]|nr:hypothetical protein [Bacillota bacterium]
MTLKSLDLQVLLPRVQEVGRIQHVQQINEQNQQLNFAAHLLKESEATQQTVQNLSQSREGRIKERTREDRQSLTEKKGQKKGTPQEKKEPAPGKTQEFLTNLPLGQVVDLKI